MWPGFFGFAGSSVFLGDSFAPLGSYFSWVILIASPRTSSTFCSFFLDMLMLGYCFGTAFGDSDFFYSSD